MVVLKQRRSRTLLLLRQLTQELDVPRRAGPPFVVNIRENAVLVQEFQQSGETNSRQCHVAREELRAEITRGLPNVGRRIAWAA